MRRRYLLGRQARVLAADAAPLGVVCFRSGVPSSRIGLRLLHQALDLLQARVVGLVNHVFDIFIKTLQPLDFDEDH